MTDHEALFSELRQLNARLNSIEKTLSTIAVQEEKISSLKIQVDGMWRKYDAAFGPEGTISKLKENYASCPKETIKHNLALQWMAIATIVAMITALKIWG